MRALTDRSSTARRVLTTLFVAVVAFGLATGPASAGAADSKSGTPPAAFKRFQFEFEMGVSVGSDGPSITMLTTGSYVGPKSQECEATASFGPGIEVTRRAVVIGRSTWIDDGRGLKKAKSRDFDWIDECPSSPTFWADLPFGDFPPGLHGETEMRGGVAVEHFDLTEIAGAVTTLIEDFPPDVTPERMSLWLTKRDGVVVGLDIAMRGTSESTCRTLLELDGDEAAPASCLMTIRLDVTRINDHELTIKGGRGADGRVVKV